MQNINVEQSFSLNIKGDDYTFIAHEGRIEIQDFDFESEWIAHVLSHSELDFPYSAFIAREVLKELKAFPLEKFEEVGNKYIQWANIPLSSLDPSNLFREAQSLSRILEAGIYHPHILANFHIPSDLISWWGLNYDQGLFAGKYELFLRSVVQNPKARYEDLRKIAKLGDYFADMHILKHPKCDQDLRLHMARGAKTRHMTRILKELEGKIPFDVANICLHDPNMHVRRRLAIKEIDAEIMWDLTKDPVYPVREALAKNPWLDDTSKIALSKDKRVFVLLNLCKQDFLPKEAWINLLASKHKEVATALEINFKQKDNLKATISGDFEV